MDKEKLIENLSVMDRAEMFDLIDHLPIDIKKTGKDDELRESIKVAIEAYDPEAADKASKKEDKTDKAGKKEAKEAGAPKKLGKEVSGVVRGIANINEGPLAYQVLSVSVSLPGAALIKCIAPAGQHEVGAKINVPVIS